MKTQIILTIIIIVLFGVYSFSIYELGKSKAKTQIIRDTDTVITYKTNIIEKIVPKYYQVIKKDTVITTEKDTIYIDNTQFIAQVDTSIENDDAHLKVQYIQDLPLSKNGFFNIDLQTKNQLVFVPTYKAYEPDTWGIGAGLVGRFQDSVRVNLFGNISYKIMNYKYFELPITAELEFGDNLNIVEKTFRIEGRFKF